LFVHGAADTVVPLEEGRAVYEEAPGPKAFLTLAEGGHTAPYSDVDDPDFHIVRSVTTAFLRWALQDSPGALDELREDARRSDRAALTSDRLNP
jgi:fermentation-respiration switch protein FrsA (DUF1100 family)